VPAVPHRRRRTDEPSPHRVHDDDAHWHEGPDEQRSRKVPAHDGPRDPRPEPSPAATEHSH